MDMFVLWTYGSRQYGIPMKQFHIIRKNFRDGKPWWLCSPVYPLTRQEFARIVTADVPQPA